MSTNRLLEEFNQHFINYSQSFTGDQPLFHEVISQFTSDPAEREYIRRHLDQVGAIGFNGSNTTIKSSKMLELTRPGQS